MGGAKHAIELRFLAEIEIEVEVGIVGLGRQGMNGIACAPRASTSPSTFAVDTRIKEERREGTSIRVHRTWMLYSAMLCNAMRCDVIQYYLVCMDM